MPDVNGTRYHLMLGEHDWRPLLSLDSGLEWDAADASVTLRRLPLRGRRRPPAVEPLDSDRRRGAGRDRWGNIYWIGAGNDRIFYLPDGTGEAGQLWQTADLFAACEPAAGSDFIPRQPSSPPALPRLRGLTVTHGHYLVAGTLDPAGLLIFDLHASGPPSWLRWPAAVPFAPFDLAPTVDGGVVVLDRGADASRLWLLDRFFNVASASARPPDLTDASPTEVPDFRPVTGAPRTAPCRATTLTRSLAHDLDLPWALAVEPLPDGSFLVLDSDPASPSSRVWRFLAGEPHGQAALEDLDGDHVIGHDFAFLADELGPTTSGLDTPAVRGELHVVSSDGGQVWVFHLEADDETLRLRPSPRYLPLRSFGGRALLAGAGEVVYDFQPPAEEPAGPAESAVRWLPVAEQPRRRYASQGTLRGLVFDGQVPGTVWHRLMLDACLPDDRALQVESRAADERGLLASAPWQSEPAPVLIPAASRVTGESELPYHRPWSERALQREGTGTWELLFQSAAGRFLELRLRLRADGHRSPRLHALRVWYPRFSYLEEYLPAIYREDVASASFLDRFLANPESLYTALEGRIEHSEMLFDPRTAPPEYLEWLGGWLGAVLDPEWGEARRRLFIAHAVELFRWRGTRAGLLAAIRIAIDPCPDESIFEILPGRGGAPEATGAGVRVVEGFLTRELPGVVFGDPSELAGPGFIRAGNPWRPGHGAAALHRRYRDFLHKAGRGIADGEVSFPPLPPDAPEQQAVWSSFIRRELSFPYARVQTQDAPLYQQFLARRYRRVAELNRAYRRPPRSVWTSFDEIELPLVLPEGRAALADWIDFVSLALPLERNAHRFTVLVPATPGETREAMEERRRRVEEIVRHQKPVHTECEVKLYWALFQVGGARLGLDTVLGEGGRFVALTLGSGYLGDSFLKPAPPWGISDRRVISRDPLASESRL